MNLLGFFYSPVFNAPSLVSHDALPLTLSKITTIFY